MIRPVQRLLVVVPAHNEGDTIGACLDALHRAAQQVAAPVQVLVVLDSCSDGTAAACHRSVDTIRVDARNVGMARDAGVKHLLAGQPEPDRVWIANTDADTVIPATWLRDQIRLADAGADVVAGVVDLSPGVSPTAAHPLLRQRFGRRYRESFNADGTHSHVHGANLGLRGSVYLQVGGFPPVASHEDRRLLGKLERAGVSGIVRSSRLIVETSARLDSRCSDGFASELSRMAGGGGRLEVGAAAGHGAHCPVPC